MKTREVISTDIHYSNTTPQIFLFENGVLRMADIHDEDPRFMDSSVKPPAF
jgi:hypothetical protein